VVHFLVFHIMNAPNFIAQDRHGGYIFRRKIPAELRQYFHNKREIRRSLRTHHRGTAIQLARSLAAQTDILFGELLQMARKKNDYHKKAERKAVELAIEQAKLHNQLVLSRDNESDFLGMLREWDLEHVTETLETELAGIEYKAELLAGHEDREWRRRLAEEAERETGLKPGTLSAPVHAGMVAAGGPASSAPKISTILPGFKAFKRGGKSDIQENTFDEYEMAISDFVFIVGDLQVDAITFANACYFRDTSQKLPKHRNKKAVFIDKTCEELLALNTPESMNLSATTIDGRLGFLKTIFDWLVRSNQVSVNPFAGVSLSHEKKSYPLLTTADLATIFSSELYTDSSYSRRLTTTAAHWWFPLFSLWSGARPGELVQLRIDNIRSIGGVLTAEVVEDEETGQSTKTQAAQRTFPIHPKLLELGFEEYLDRIRQSGYVRVFESIPLGKRKAGEVVSKWYNERYRDKGGYLPASFKEERKVLYCFRCTYITEALNARVPLRDLQQMVGHEKSMVGYERTLGATKHYDRGQPMQVLRSEIEKITFPELDLPHLKKDGWQKLQRL